MIDPSKFRTVDKKKLRNSLKRYKRYLEALELIYKELQKLAFGFMLKFRVNEEIESNKKDIERISKQLTCKHLEVIEDSYEDHHTGVEYLTVKCKNCDFLLYDA